MTITTECKCCGKEFSWEKPPGTRGRLRRYCSDGCKNKRRARKIVINLVPIECAVCLKVFNAKHPKHITCSAECSRKRNKYIKKKYDSAVISMADCEQCGREFGVTLHRRRFCGIKCANANTMAKRHPDYREPTTASEKLATERMQLLSKWRRKCTKCGHVFARKVSVKKDGGICKACRPASPFRITPPTPDGFVFCCNQCGRMLVRPRNNGIAAKCNSCQDVLGRAIRKEIKRRRDYRERSTTPLAGKRFTRKDIFIRDQWTCCLCGVRVRQTVDYAPDQATVDHIIPLSRGGKHVPENCQCACHRCNSLKSDAMPMDVVSMRDGGRSLLPL